MVEHSDKRVAVYGEIRKPDLKKRSESEIGTNYRIHSKGFLVKIHIIHLCFILNFIRRARECQPTVWGKTERILDPTRYLSTLVNQEKK